MLKRGFLRTEDNEKIAFKHYTGSPARDRAVVIAHGFYNSKDSVLLTGLAEHLFREQDVFMFDFRGHGESSGLYTWTAKESMDLLAVLTRLLSEYSTTGVVGFSLGASTCINVLAEASFNVDRLVCVSAVSDPGKIDWRPWKIDWENDVMYSLFSKAGRRGKGARPGPWWLDKESPGDNAPRLDLPVLYIHGDADPVVGKWHSQVLMKRTSPPKKLKIIKNGPHAEYLLRGGRNVQNMIKEGISCDQE